MVKKQKDGIGNIDSKKMLEMAKAVRVIRISVSDIKNKEAEASF